MKEFLKFNGFDLYQSGDKPEKLAEKVINRVLHREITIEDLPVDPFYLLKKSGVVYTFLNFDKYEGFYLLNTEYDGPKTKTMVGINKNRPIARQRFTARTNYVIILKMKRHIIVYRERRMKLKYLLINLHPLY